MANTLIPKIGKSLHQRHGVPAAPWLWRQAKGSPVRIDKMETMHVFYTLRMIWNNTMPPEARVGVVKLYHFPNHSPAYLREAAARMLDELAVRSDVPVWAANEVEQMRCWFQLRLDLAPKPLGSNGTSKLPSSRRLSGAAL